MALPEENGEVSDENDGAKSTNNNDIYVDMKIIILKAKKKLREIQIRRTLLMR